MANYTSYVIGRNFVKITGYEKINTGRKRRAAQNPTQSQPMTQQELDLAYQYRQRAKREKLLRVADINFEVGACVFVTLTFRENVQDYDTAVRAFKLFTKRLRRKLEDVRYIATLEIQQRGAYHFHTLVNAPNVQFGLDNITELWNNGIVDIRAVTDIKETILYMTKDLVQQNRSHPLFKKRCYFVSQGLTQCEVISTWNGTKAQLQGVQQMLYGRAPNKYSQVNSANAGQVEFEDYYFQTNRYPAPSVAKLRPF